MNTDLEYFLSIFVNEIDPCFIYQVIKQKCLDNEGSSTIGNLSIVALMEEAQSAVFQKNDFDHRE